MPSPPVTFPCPFCGRRMGVPAELLGRQVRCPHCKQVVLAPVSPGPSAAPAPQSVAPPQPVAAPPAPAPVPVPAPAPVIQIASPPPAPAPQPAAPPPCGPPQTAAVSPPLPQTEPELPVFSFPHRKEGADSILSEPDESDDEVFGSQAGGRLRTLPPFDFANAPTAPVEP